MESHTLLAIWKRTQKASLLGMTTHATTRMTPTLRRFLYWELNFIVHVTSVSSSSWDVSNDSF